MVDLNISRANDTLLRYDTFDHLCQAVQYAPLVASTINAVASILLMSLCCFIFQLILVGTGRARADDGYAHLLSSHLVLAFTIFGMLFLLNVWNFIFILQTVPRLLQPQPATHFVTDDTMHREIGALFNPSYSALWWISLALYTVMMVLLNLDFLRKFCGVDQTARLKRLLQEAGNLPQSPAFSRLLAPAHAFSRLLTPSPASTRGSPPHCR